MSSPTTLLEEDEYARQTGALIKHHRTTQKLSQERLSWKAEVSRETIRKIENGDASPRAYTLARIAKGLGVSLWDLLPPEGDELRGWDSNPQPTG